MYVCIDSKLTLLVWSRSMNDSQQLFKMNIKLLFFTFPTLSYGIFNQGTKYVPMGYKEASCPPNIPTKKQGGGNINYF